MVATLPPTEAIDAAEADPPSNGLISGPTLEEIAAMPDLAERVGAIDARRHRLYEPELEQVKGLWDEETKLFARYRVTIRCTGFLMGGVPQDPDIVAGWLRSKAGVTDEEELLEATKQNLRELGIAVPATATWADLKAVSEQIASERKGNSFKRDRVGGLYVEGRQPKAGLKESTNTLFAGDRWGATRKGPKSFLAERVFVDTDRIYLGRHEPDGRHLQVGQVTGPQGPRSTLTLYDYVIQPVLTFDVLSLQDCIPHEIWKALLLHGQQVGIGALRSQGYGRYKVIGFDLVERADPLPKWDGISATVGEQAAEAKPKRVRTKKTA